MGITIHYGGRAASEDSIANVFSEGIAIARELGWLGRVPPKELLRESGLVLLPHQDCEPLHIRFTKTRRFSDFCKTQFAGPVVHLQVRQFFDRLSPNFSKLIVHDEAEDFEVDGEVIPLEQAFDKALEFIKEGLVDHPGAQMKVRLSNGRIADLVE